MHDVQILRNSLPPVPSMSLLSGASTLGFVPAPPFCLFEAWHAEVDCCKGFSRVSGPFVLCCVALDCASVSSQPVSPGAVMP